MNASTGIRKPPLAPKPKVVPPPKPGFPPVMQRREVLSQQRPRSPAKIKPPLAPKPCLAKLTALGRHSPVTPKSLHLPVVTAKTAGILNSQNRTQQENKRPNWDYINPICLCSNPNCMCILSAHSVHLNKKVKGFKSDPQVKDRDCKISSTDVEAGDKNAENHEEKTTSASSHTTNHQPPHSHNFKTNIDTSRTIHFTAASPQGVSNCARTAKVPQEDACIPALAAILPEPKFASPALEKPGPSPSTPKKTLLTSQQEAVEQKEMVSQSGEWKKGETESVSSSDSEWRPSQFLSAPPPKKKLFLSVLADIVEEDLGWDCNPHKMEVSVDAEEVLSEEKEGYYVLACSPSSVKPFFTEPSLSYENVAVYEEIQDYELMTGGMEDSSHSPPLTAAWLRRTEDDDEGIYEEPEPYMSLQETSANQHLEPFDRKSAELAVGHGGPSDDDTIEQTSDEGDSSSVTSSERTVTPDRPKKSKIQHIATEIMSSEAVFVDVLKLLHVDFRDAVSRASQQSGRPVIEDRLLNQILYSLPQLYELNQDLLRELESRVATWDEDSQLADIFLQKGPFLKMYSTYIQEVEKNVALLEEQTEKNAAFRAVVRGFEASPRCANLALRHYLLKPVQRIPQYQLLLREYLKNLPPDSVEHKNAEAALHVVKNVADHANDFMKQGDNFQKMIQVQCSLTGGHVIVQPGRLFVKEGTLKKLSRKGMQPRTLFLFNDTLLYTTPAKSGQYTLNKVLSLAGMKVSKPSQEAYQNELLIESVERSFILSASSAAERDEWLEAISTAISEYTKKKITFITGKISEEVEIGENDNGCALGSKAPILVPDIRATMCMICTCEFTLMWRRHHCRACGKVVCKSCSSNKHCLEYMKNQAARVCDCCFIALNQPKCEACVSPVSPSKAAFTFRRQKKIPAALKEVSANTANSSISGHLLRSKGSKKQWKRLWFVIKDKVLYTYAASEDVAALESQPLLGFSLKEDRVQEFGLRLYHKDTLFYSFKVEDQQIAQRWIEAFKESTVL
ncbi:FYVE, RhoGEF and PH domain-containing protein 6-like [Synchiropus picturatus]